VASKEEKQVGITKILATLIIAAAALLGSGNVATAAYCDSSSNGCIQSMGNTDCAGAGGFGAFGEKHGPLQPHDFRGGASGDRTGYNNSTLCGNPQGAAGELGD
jgi:hypothetical protein